MSLEEFSGQYLFTPLGIEDFSWANCMNSSDFVFASGGLYLRPRDMAKYGQIYMQNGIWNEQQIVPSEWITLSLNESVHFSNMRGGPNLYHYGYGYQWFLGKYMPENIQAYCAQGWGGQFIVVIPEKDLVAVTTAGNYEANDPFEVSPFDVYNYIIYNHILSAIN